MSIARMGGRVILQGGIAVGKSATLELLGKEENYKVYPEPVEKWSDFEGHNLLRAFYDSPPEERGATLFRLQVLIATSLRERRNEAEEYLRKNAKQTVILERCINSSQIFLKANRSALGSRDYSILNYMLKLLETTDDDATNICLVADFDTVRKRLEARGRGEERNIDLAYLRHVNKAMEEEARRRNWPTIDTGSLTASEVALEVKKTIDNFK